MSCLRTGLFLATAPLATLAAQEPGPGPSFLIFRYASASSLGMYSGYTTGKILLVVGMLHNPRSAYREIMAGAGKPFTAANGNGLTIVPALAYTNTGWYSQLYFLPTLRAGAWSGTGTLQFVQPLSGRGARGVSVSPGNLLCGVGHGFSAGAAYYGSAEAGSRPSHGAGLAVQRVVPHGSVTLELVKGITSARDEVRLTLRSSY